MTLQTYLLLVPRVLNLHKAVLTFSVSRNSNCKLIFLLPFRYILLLMRLHVRVTIKQKFYSYLFLNSLNALPISVNRITFVHMKKLSLEIYRSNIFQIWYKYLSLTKHNRRTWSIYFIFIYYNFSWFIFVLCLFTLT